MTNTLPDPSLYRQAAKYIEEGWTQGHLMDGRGVCLLGALMKARGVPFDATDILSKYDEILAAAIDHLFVLVGAPAHSLPWRPEEAFKVKSSWVAAWNDIDSRTKDEVLEVLMRAELEAEAARSLKISDQRAKSALTPQEMAEKLYELKVQIEALETNLVPV